jgi:hypothetical protein
MARPVAVTQRRGCQLERVPFHGNAR